MNRAALPLLLAPLLVAGLSGCQDRAARDENARLNERVVRLEAQVQELQRQARAGAAGENEVVLRAAAQNCANDLSRFLETTREGSGGYPSARLVELPDSCVDLRVNWRGLSGAAYAFEVTGSDGRVLATGQGP